MTARSRTLFSHLFQRLLEGDESTSPTADSRLRLIQVLALIAMPGLVVPVRFHVTHPYTYVMWSMAVVGLAMTLRWDSLFPDRRDYLILTPLPVSPREVFLAGAAALGAFLALFVVAANLFSMWIVPLARAGREPGLGALQAVFAHLAGTFGGALFVAFTIAAAHGVLLQALPIATFRKISPRIQMLSTISLVTALMVTPLVQATAVALAAQSRLVSYFPPIWFYGLYDYLSPGEPSSPLSKTWAVSAVLALATSGATCAVSYAVGYWRHSQTVVEGAEARPAGPLRVQTFANALLNRGLLRQPRERAVFHFIGKISRRSGRHRTLTALYYGIGAGLALSTLFAVDPGSPVSSIAVSKAGALEAPLILSFLFIAGLRATFSVPCELPANWVFRVAAGHGSHYLRAARRWVFLCRLLPLYGVLAPLEFVLFGPPSILHLALDLMATALMLEAFFFGFRKIPYTCSRFPEKVHLGILVVLYLFGFTTSIAWLGSVKRWALTGPVPAAITLLTGTAGILAASRLSGGGGRKDAPIVFDEAESPFVSLDLS